MMESGLLFNSLLLVLGIAALVRSGIYVVRSLSSIAQFLGLAEYTISFILMALATSLPELFVGVSAALSGNPALSLGNVLGTNIVNLTLILGLIAVVAGRVNLNDYEDFTSTRLINFLFTVSPVVLLFDGTLSRLDGIILLIFFLWSFSMTLGLRERFVNGGIRGIFRGSAVQKVQKTAKDVRGFFNSFSVFVISAAVLMVSSYVLVLGASNLSLQLGLSEILIGVLIVGLGTSLPELAFGIRSAAAGKGDMSLGNLLGSSVINSTLILGVTAVLSPIAFFEPNAFWTSAFFMAASMLLAYYFLRTKNFLVRKEGLVLIFAYIIFVFIQAGVSFF